MGPLDLVDDSYLKPRCGKGRSGTRWYLQKRVPKDIQDKIGKKIIEVALNTDSLQEAKERRHAVLAKILADFARARSKTITSANIEDEARQYFDRRLRTKSFGNGHSPYTGEPMSLYLPQR